MFHLNKAKRENVRLKIGLTGPSGSGKTLSALKLAHGITGSWDNVVIADTENNSALYYADNEKVGVGTFGHIPFEGPFSPQRYVELINFVEQKTSAEVLILDSVSHEWDACITLVDEYAKNARNSFAAWGQVTPLHNKFVTKMLQSPLHIIANIRSKQDYVIEANAKGKQVPRKVGLKGIQRDGIDYEFGIMFDIEQSHYATSSKDRTGLFADAGPFMITEETGKSLVAWANSGIYVASLSQMTDLKRTCELHGITDKDVMREISKKLINKEMSELEKIIKEVGTDGIK